MKKPNILVVGSFVMDLITGTKRVPGSGESVLGLSFSTAPGGKGANQAMQAARLGAAVKMVGKVGGDDFGKTLTGSLRDAGVDVGDVLIDPETSSAVGNITLEITDRGNQNRIIIVPGANHTITVGDVAFLEKALAGYDMVMLQLEITPQVNEFVARCAAGAGVPVMMNSAPYAPMSPELLRSLTYLSPNEHEAGDMSGVEIRTVEDARRAAEIIRQQGVANVLITLGAQGAVLLEQSGNFIHSPAAPDIRRVDPTAAGDSFVAAFCTGLCAGLSHEQALEFAGYTATITISRMGAQPSLPALEEVLAYMEQCGAALPAQGALAALREGR